jgi:hypothetical protein
VASRNNTSSYSLGTGFVSQRREPEQNTNGTSSASSSSPSSPHILLRTGPQLRRRMLLKLVTLVLTTCQFCLVHALNWRTRWFPLVRTLQTDRFLELSSSFTRERPYRHCYESIALSLRSGLGIERIQTYCGDTITFWETYSTGKYRGTELLMRRCSRSVSESIGFRGPEHLLLP